MDQDRQALDDHVRQVANELTRPRHTFESAMADQNDGSGRGSKAPRCPRTCEQICVSSITEVPIGDGTRRPDCRYRALAFCIGHRIAATARSGHSVRWP
jgi:hypothetical protein